MGGNDGGGGNDHDGLFGDLQGMGILNALRTGDPRVDMVIAILFPFFVKQFFVWYNDMKSFILKHWFAPTTPYMDERIIQHLEHKDRYGYSNSDDDTQNTILLKAIQLYLHKQLRLELPTAEVDLTSTEDKNANVTNNNDHYYYYDRYEASNGSDDDDNGKTLVGALSKYSIVKKPPPGRWHDLGKFSCLPNGGSKTSVVNKNKNNNNNNNAEHDSDQDFTSSCMVRLKIEKNEEDQSKDGGSTKHTTFFRFQAEDGRAIDNFIQQAYNWYMGELRKMEDHARYLYELKADDYKKRDDKGTGDRSYTRYKLSDEKTFDSLFFSQKDGLLKILNHFQERSGKYAIKGYPHKLGLLLHGPPGSGKTSLIKALAHYTNRSIVNVPLARVDTNSELMAIFNNARKYVDGESVPVKLGFKDVIFVMEDVDAASNIVKRRDGKKTADMIRIDELDMPLPKPLWHMFLESSDDSCKSLVATLREKSERLKEEASCPDLVKKVAQRVVSVPGLSVIGEAGEDPSLQRISTEAINMANQIMEDQSGLDSFLGKQATIINNLLQQGAEVDDELVDDLLRCKPLMPMLPGKLSREISYTRTAQDVNPRVELTNEAIQSQITHSFSDANENAGKSDKTQGDNKSDKSGSGKSLIGPPMSALASKFNFDELNLSGLLNVLDGVVDSPGRILIMTTNHVEQLDPALIRPGRIDKKLLLGYMSPVDIYAMLEHYFQTTLDGLQKSRIQSAVVGDAQHPQLKLTPAQIEQMTAEYDEVEEMIAALEIKGGVSRRHEQHLSSKSMVAFDL